MSRRELHADGGVDRAGFEIAADAGGALPLLDRLARRAVLRRLGALVYGQIALIDATGQRVFRGREPGPVVNLRVHRPAFFRAVARSGAVGAAESYMRGDWSVDDLTALVRLLVRNRSAAERLEGRIAPVVGRLANLLQPLRGVRRNIAAHYDLGNEFFEIVLDPTLSYSCALFEREGMSLEDASRAKLARIAWKLRLAARDHLLDVGCGWGGLALWAAREIGCRVTAVTISRAQHAFACRRVQEAGLGDRVGVVLADYRQLRGQFDKIVSIEMIEAVRPAQYRAFFRRCSDLLAPDGMMLLQAIVIDDRYFEQARRSADFIRRYIFPGGCLPSTSALSAAAARTDLRLTHLEDWTPHYPRTLRRWWDNLRLNADAVRALGFTDAFIRMWEFYFAYCEGGFLERHIGDVQMVFSKPRCRVDPILGSLAPA